MATQRTLDAELKTRVTHATRRKIDLQAKRKRVKPAHIIREAITQYLERTEKVMPS